MSEERIKGSAVIFCVKRLRLERALAEKNLRADLHHYLDKPVLVSKWYSEADFLELLRALARIVPDPGIDVWEWIGREGARKDFRDLYAPMIQRNRPRETLLRYPRVWSLYHDKGEVEIRDEEDGAVRIDIQGFMVEDADFCRLMTGHFAEILSEAGATDIDVSLLAVSTRERPAGWRCRWR